MFSGFQSNAFQNNAFQIVVFRKNQGAGAGRKRRLTQKDISDLLEEYKRVSTLPIAKEKEEEIVSGFNRLLKNQEKIKPIVHMDLLLESLPPIDEIDLDKILQNSSSLEELDLILEKIRSWEEEELCLLLLLAT